MNYREQFTRFNQKVATKNFEWTLHLHPQDLTEP